VAPESVVGTGHGWMEPVSLEGYHKAVDLQAVRGTPVLSPVDGVVANVKYEPKGLGLQVQIMDKKKTLHTLAHLDKVNVAIGDRVKAGQDVAEVGDSGAGATGPHLDYRRQTADGQYQDPTADLGALAQMPRADKGTDDPFSAADAGPLAMMPRSFDPHQYWATEIPNRPPPVRGPGRGQDVGGGQNMPAGYKTHWDVGVGQVEGYGGDIGQFGGLSGYEDPASYGMGGYGAGPQYGSYGGGWNPYGENYDLSGGNPGGTGGPGGGWYDSFPSAQSNPSFPGPQGLGNWFDSFAKPSPMAASMQAYGGVGPETPGGSGGFGGHGYNYGSNYGGSAWSVPSPPGMGGYGGGGNAYTGGPPLGSPGFSGTPSGYRDVTGSYGGRSSGGSIPQSSSRGAAPQSQPGQSGGGYGSQGRDTMPFEIPEGVYGQSKWLPGSQGTDIFMRRGSPITAKTGGQVLYATGGTGLSGGSDTIAQFDDGTVARFRHVQPGLQAGSRFSAGQTIATIGDSSMDMLNPQVAGQIGAPDGYQHLDLSINQPGHTQFSPQGGGGGDISAAQWLQQHGYRGRVVGRTPGPQEGQMGGMGGFGGPGMGVGGFPGGGYPGFGPGGFPGGMGFGGFGRGQDVGVGVGQQAPWGPAWAEHGNEPASLQSGGQLDPGTDIRNPNWDTRAGWQNTQLPGYDVREMQRSQAMPGDPWMPNSRLQPGDIGSNDYLELMNRMRAGGGTGRFQPGDFTRPYRMAPGVLGLAANFPEEFWRDFLSPAGRAVEEWIWPPPASAPGYQEPPSRERDRWYTEPPVGGQDVGAGADFSLLPASTTNLALIKGQGWDPSGGTAGGTGATPPGATGPADPTVPSRTPKGNPVPFSPGFPGPSNVPWTPATQATYAALVAAENGTSSPAAAYAAAAGGTPGSATSTTGGGMGGWPTIPSGWTGGGAFDPFVRPGRVQMFDRPDPTADRVPWIKNATPPTPYSPSLEQSQQWGQAAQNMIQNAPPIQNYASGIQASYQTPSWLSAGTGGGPGGGGGASPPPLPPLQPFRTGADLSRQFLTDSHFVPSAPFPPPVGGGQDNRVLDAVPTGRGWAVPDVGVGQTPYDSFGGMGTNPYSGFSGGGAPQTSYSGGTGTTGSSLGFDTSGMGATTPNQQGQLFIGPTEAESLSQGRYGLLLNTGQLGLNQQLGYNTMLGTQGQLQQIDDQYRQYYDALQQQYAIHGNDDLFRRQELALNDQRARDIAMMQYGTQQQGNAVNLTGLQLNYDQAMARLQQEWQVHGDDNQYRNDVLALQKQTQEQANALAQNQQTQQGNQFWGNLGEQESQYARTLEEQRSQFGQNLGFQRETLAQQMGLSHEQLAAQIAQAQASNQQARDLAALQAKNAGYDRQLALAQSALRNPWVQQLSGMAPAYGAAGGPGAAYAAAAGGAPVGWTGGGQDSGPGWNPVGVGADNPYGAWSGDPTGYGMGPARPGGGNYNPYGTTTSQSGLGYDSGFRGVGSNTGGQTASMESPAFETPTTGGPDPRPATPPAPDPGMVSGIPAGVRGFHRWEPEPV
jgi:hypothetical protein